jgi:hypothetical protein
MSISETCDPTSEGEVGFDTPSATRNLGSESQSEVSRTLVGGRTLGPLLLGRQVMNSLSISGQ